MQVGRLPIMNRYQKRKKRIMRMGKFGNYLTNKRLWD
jgi:hypothetical protein